MTFSGCRVFLAQKARFVSLLNSLSSLLTRYVQQQTDISLLSPDNFYCSHTLSRISGHGGRAEEAAGAAHGRYFSPLGFHFGPCSIIDQILQRTNSSASLARRGMRSSPSQIRKFVALISSAHAHTISSQTRNKIWDLVQKCTVKD